MFICRRMVRELDVIRHSSLMISLMYHPITRTHIQRNVAAVLSCYFLRVLPLFVIETFIKSKSAILYHIDQAIYNHQHLNFGVVNSVEGVSRLLLRLNHQPLQREDQLLNLQRKFRACQAFCLVLGSLRICCKLFVSCRLR